MADKLSSALLAAQAKIMPDYNKPELRERQNPILRVGLANQNYLMVDVKSIKESTKRTVYGYQRTRFASTNGTTRTHNFTGSQPDTAQVQLNWGVFSEKFSIYWDASADNVFNSMRDDLVNGFSQNQRNIRERIAKGLIGDLHSGRTQVANNIVRNGTFNAATDAFEITNEKLFFARLQDIMDQHKYYGQIDVLVDSVLGVVAKEVGANGSSNGVNTSWTLDKLNVMKHGTIGTEVVTDVYTDGGIALALPQNSFAFIPWIPAKYAAGLGDPNSYNGKRFTMPDETGLPITYAVWMYTERADGSSNGGTTDDMVTHVQISVDTATQVAEISAANESPIYEFALVG